MLQLCYKGCRLHGDVKEAGLAVLAVVAAVVRAASTSRLFDTAPSGSRIRSKPPRRRRKNGAEQTVERAEAVNHW